MPMKQPKSPARLDAQRVLGARLRGAREEAGLTQGEIAKRLGFAHSWFSQIERGDNGIDAIDLYRVAKLTGHSVDYFVNSDYSPRAITNPGTRTDWEAIFPGDEARARLHFEIGRAFDTVVRAETIVRPLQRSLPELPS